jgi:branched-chain amino acid transport system permease protein
MENAMAMIAGRAMHYIAAGSGEPVVWIHGNTGSSRWFERVMDIPGYRHLAPDLPNFGRSAPLDGTPDIAAYAEAVHAFMGALGVGKAIIVGHSLGGAVAMALATAHPKLAKALILVDSSAPTGLKTPETHYPVLEMMRTNKALLTQAFRGGVMPTMKDEGFFQALVDDAMLMAAPAWSGNARALERFDCLAACRKFSAPVLVVRGEKDAIITEAMARETAAAFPTARLELLDGVGHAVLVEDPERFKKLFAEFAASIR